ncbi:AIG2-like protein [Zea mays]|uniref:Putative gamma-glutamylcyclotransferase n=1 Tax=Zea mays TaxID=4577 RepID=A0A1D6H0C7_MAIZE|nr:AIG2-like protein [Zea mays]
MASPPPVATAGPHSVFVYGTLMEEEVVRVLLGRAPPSSSPALLPDHRRFSLRGRVYPAILPARAHAVSGKEWRKVHLKYYLEMTREFMLELGQF